MYTSFKLYRHVLYNWQRLTRHLVHRSYDGHIIPYWKSQRCKHDSNISQRKSSQACKSLAKCFAPTDDTQVSSHPHNTPYIPHDSDNHIVMYKILLRALCLHAHTHYTHVISRFAAPAQIFTLKTAITYAGQENLDTALLKPSITHTFCTPTHTELSPSLYRQDIRKDIIQRRKWHYSTCTMYIQVHVTKLAYRNVGSTKC